MNKLKEIRKKRGYTRKEVTELSGVSEQTIKMLEMELRDIGESQIITLVNLAKALKCKVRDIVPDEIRKRL